MTLLNEINAMYQEIVDYGGNFGDPIDTGTFDPFALIQSNGLSDFERAGASVAILCILESRIDNSCHAEVIQSSPARQALFLKENGYFSEMPCVEQAIDALFESEYAYAIALKEVYTCVVIPEVQGV